MRLRLPRLFGKDVFKLFLRIKITRWDVIKLTRSNHKLVILPILLVQQQTELFKNRDQHSRALQSKTDLCICAGAKTRSRPMLITTPTTGCVTNVELVKGSSVLNIAYQDTEKDLVLPSSRESPRLIKIIKVVTVLKA